jgi:ubiquinone/menaquinone biosynthesis C-methylase UbiE
MKIKLTLMTVAILCGHLFCAVLESNRDSWQQPQRILDSLGIHSGMAIGEAGAGEGYFTFHLSERIGENGKIFANDIKKSVLEDIEDRCEDDEIHNIITVLGEEKDPLFPVDNLDMVIMMRAFHDFRYQVAWMKNVQRYMKSGATMVIIDTDPDKTGNGHDHFMTRQEILDVMEKTDFKLQALKTFLPRDNIYIYRVQLPD